MTRPVVHIGAPKTGSTWLQRAVFPRVIGRTYIGPGSPHRLPDIALADLPFQNTDSVFRYSEAAARELFREFGPALFSQEELSGAIFDRPAFSLFGVTREELVSRLAAALPDADIMLVTREPGSYCKSAYSTYVNQGGTQKFEDFLESVLPPHYTEWDAWESELRSRFKRVVVYRFEEIVADRAAFICRLSSDLHLQFHQPGLDEVVNRSMSVRRREVVRFLNHFRPSGLSQRPEWFPIRGVTRLVQKIS